MRNSLLAVCCLTALACTPPAQKKIQLSDLPNNNGAVEPALELSTELTNGLSIAPGDSVNATFTTGAKVAGFTHTGNVTATVANVPNGVTALVSPATFASGTSAALSIAVGLSAAAGVYTLKLGATDDRAQSAEALVNVTVLATGATMEAPRFVVVPRNGSATLALTLSRQPGSQRQLSSSLSGAPSGLSVSGSVSAGQASGALQFSATNSVVPGQYPVTLNLVDNVTGVATGRQVLVVVPGDAATLDTSFHSDGIVSLTYPGDPEDAVELADGRLIVVQIHRQSGYNGMAVSAIMPDGTLDSSFASAGVFYRAETSGGATKVIVDHAGRIVVAGFGASKLIVVRLTQAGVLDTSFGGDGIVEIATSTFAYPGGLFELPTHQLFVQAALGSACAFTRLSEDGSPDPVLGGSGYVASDFSSAIDYCAKLVPHPNGAFYLSTRKSGEGKVAKLNAASLLLDGAFGVSGMVGVSGANVELAVDDAQRLLVAHGAGGASGFLGRRSASNGAVDGAFTTASLGSTPYSLLPRAGGKVIVSDRLGWQPRINQRDANGTLDSSFPGFTIETGVTDDYVLKMLHLRDGRIILLGMLNLQSSAPPAFVRRLWP